MSYLVARPSLTNGSWPSWTSFSRVRGRKCLLFTHVESLFTIFEPDLRAAELRTTHHIWHPTGIRCEHGCRAGRHAELRPGNAGEFDVRRDQWACGQFVARSPRRVSPPPGRKPATCSGRSMATLRRWSPTAKRDWHSLGGVVHGSHSHERAFPVCLRRVGRQNRLPRAHERGGRRYSLAVGRPQSLAG